MKRLKIIAIMLVIALFTGNVLPEYTAMKAQAAKSTQQQLDEAQKEKDKLENELDKQQDKLEQLQDEKKGLQGELQDLNTQLTEVSEHLADLETQIAEKEEDIEATTLALEEAIRVEQEQYESMVVHARNMYERNDSSIINALLDIKSLFRLLNRADWFEQIEAYDKSRFEEYKENCRFITETKETLEKQKLALDYLLLAAEEEKSKVSGLISQTSKTISKYADDIEAAEQKAREYEEEIRKKEEDLEYLKKVLEEEKRLSQAAANGVWRSISDITFAVGDRYLLANLIYCEAGGEPYEGQVAVGAVVINRMLSSKFPDTLVGVVYQKNQFAPAGSGRLELALARNLANESCYKAADEAMAGVTNVGNCLFFRRPVPGVTGINIAHHVFY